MNVFKRMSDIVSANINDVLDKIEDPEKMINLMISEIEETVISLKASIAEKEGARTTLSRQIKECEEAVKRWNERARLAVEKGSDELAREAIKEKLALNRQSTSLKESLSTLDSIIASLKEQLSKAVSKLEEMKEKRDSLASRAAAAKEKMKASQTLSKSESSDFAHRFEELQARIEKWEAEAEVATENVTAKTFEQMEAERDIEAELKALKEKAKKEEED